MRRKARGPDQESIPLTLGTSKEANLIPATPLLQTFQRALSPTFGPNSHRCLPLTRSTPHTQPSQGPRGPGHTGLSSALGLTWHLRAFAHAVPSSWTIYPTSSPTPSYLQPICQVSDETSPPWGTLLCLSSAHTLAQGSGLVPQSPSHDAMSLSFPARTPHDDMRSLLCEDDPNR